MTGREDRAFVETADELEKRHGTLLRSLVGESVEGSWVAWENNDDEWFPDEPVVLRVGGRNVEFVHSKLSSLWIDIDSIDIATEPSWWADWDFDLEWRRDAHPALQVARGRQIEWVEIVEHFFTTRPAGRAGPETGGWVLSGVGFGLAGDAYLEVFNALDQNGLGQALQSGSGYRRRRVGG